MDYTKTDCANIEQLNRRQIRYLLFRISTHKKGGANTDDCGNALGIVSAHFEKSRWLIQMGGFKGFGSKWDVNEDDGLTIVPLEKTLIEQWHDELREKVKNLP